MVRPPSRFHYEGSYDDRKNQTSSFSCQAGNPIASAQMASLHPVPGPLRALTVRHCAENATRPKKTHLWLDELREANCRGTPGHRGRRGSSCNSIIGCVLLVCPSCGCVFLRLLEPMELTRRATGFKTPVGDCATHKQLSHDPHWGKSL